MPSATQPVLLDGWYPEEHDGLHAFRWIGRSASCRVTCPQGAWLRITAGNGRAGEAPVLSVTARGRLLGARAVSGPASRCLFPIGAAGEVDITLAVDRTFVPPGDGRELGVMVRSVEVVDGAAGDAPVDGEGWNEWERHEYFPFRWMGGEASVLLPAALRRKGRFLALPVCCDYHDRSQVLTVHAGGATLAQVPLLYQWHVYDIELPEATPEQRVDDAGADGSTAAAAGPGFSDAPLLLAIRANKPLPPEVRGADTRDLSVRVGPLDVHDDPRRHHRVRMFYDAAGAPAAAAGRLIVLKSGAVDRDAALAGQFAALDPYRPEGGHGWYAWEFQDDIPFRWMRRTSRVTVPEAVHQGRRFLIVPIFSDYEDLSQTLTVSAGDAVTRLELAHRWTYYSLPLPGRLGAPLEVGFGLDRLMPDSCRSADETRELGARIGPFVFHDDEERHAGMQFFYENVVRNRREQEAGATVLSSLPLSLGIDLFGRCNIKPACVYCLWDGMKDAEGENVDLAVDDRTLEEYGPFFRAARSLVNCSFGEPLLHPRLDEVVSLAARHGKMLELSTNGQAFTPATVAALAGKPVLLYVSLDAASPEVYARLRNERWHEIITGLTFLREARRRAGGLPKLNMVFMPMRANLGDLEAFVKLCRMIEADQLVLRPLNYLENVKIYADRGGYHFDYAKELLTLDEQREVAWQCAEFAERDGVHMVNQFEFGMSERAKKRWNLRGTDRDGR